MVEMRETVGATTERDRRRRRSGNARHVRIAREPVPERLHGQRVAAVIFGIGEVRREVDVDVTEYVAGPLEAADGEEMLVRRLPRLIQRRLPLEQLVEAGVQEAVLLLRRIKRSRRGIA